MRIVRDPGGAAESKLLAHHLTVTYIPFVVAHRAPLAQVQDFHVTYDMRQNY